MNRYQKTQDQAARKILRHIGVNGHKDEKKAYKAIRKMLRAMTGSMEWIEKNRRKYSIEFGEMKLDYSEEGVVRVLLINGNMVNVLSEIRGA